MMRASLVCLLLVSANALVFRGSNELLMITDMRPDLAAKLLSGVENRWTLEAQSLISGKSTKLEGEVEHDVVKSCTKIANSIVRGSDGEADKVQEYMTDVCAATSNKEDNALCVKFQEGVQAFMSADSQFDRDELDMTNFCQKFYSTTIRKVAEERKQAEEKQREERAKEAAEEKAKEEKAAEEALKKKADKAVAEAGTAVKSATDAGKKFEAAEKAAEELTAANESADKADLKLMEAEDKEADNLAHKARKEMERAVAVEAAEKAKAKAEKAFEKAAKEEEAKKKQEEKEAAENKEEAEKNARVEKKAAPGEKKAAPVEKKAAPAKKAAPVEKKAAPVEKKVASKH